MQINIKVHSAYRDYFSERNIFADLHSYGEIMSYLANMHPRFMKYLKQTKEGGIEEGFVLLDKDKREIKPEELMLRRIKKSDTIHIVPAIIGGGGKRGGLLALLAVASFFIVPGLAVGLAGVLPGAGAASAGALGAAVASAGASTATTALTVIKASTFLSSIATNVGLALLSAIFTKAPESADTSSRQNGMFSGLTNTVDSGTPIPVHYGMVRIAGHMISGYIKTVDHDKGDNILVSEVVNES